MNENKFKESMGSIRDDILKIKETNSVDAKFLNNLLRKIDVVEDLYKSDILDNDEQIKELNAINKEINNSYDSLLSKYNDVTKKCTSLEKDISSKVKLEEDLKRTSIENTQLKGKNNSVNLNNIEILMQAVSSSMDTIKTNQSNIEERMDTVSSVMNSTNAFISDSISLLKDYNNIIASNVKAIEDMKSTVVACDKSVKAVKSDNENTKNQIEDLNNRTNTNSENIKDNSRILDKIVSTLKSWAS